MRRLRDLPIGQKLVAVGVAASALALAVSSIIFLTSTLVAMRRNVQSQIEVQATIAADNVSSALAFLDNAAAKETLTALSAFESVDAACLFDESGSLFASYTARPGIECPQSPQARGTSGILIVEPVENKGRRLGTLYLAGNYSQIRERMTSQALAAGAAILLGVLAAVLLSARIQRVIARPIRDLSSTASAISKGGDYSLRAMRHGDDEIGQLVDTFNVMLSEVERRDEELRGADRLKDEFLAALSHELRTPLNAVLGWIQVLRTTPTDAAITARAYESIERNARAQVTLIEDLLDISRIVTGKLHIKPEAVDLGATIEAALEVVRPAAAAKAIVIERQLPPRPHVVTGDAGRLQQIAWNLLSNAVKFTPKEGHVRVSLRAEQDQYCFEVADSGIGIAPEFLPHVFDRFRQGDGSLSRRYGGLGLGLAIARELTELLGGQIRAKSEGIGRGATFTVALPRRPAGADVAVQTVAIRPERLDGVHVLVVDDDEEARAVAVATLTATGGHVETVGSADDAIVALRDRHFDVILCDLAMPGTDGYQLMRRLRQEEHGASRRTPAIAVSAHVAADMDARVRASGFQGFVAKPYDLDALIVAIRQARR